MLIRWSVSRQVRRDRIDGAMCENGGIFHERQRKQLCAMHVLNNLFQAPVFTKSEMDDICTSLTPQKFWNPHRSLLGMGNYDVNVITAALQTRDLCVVWFDKRKSIAHIEFSKVKGVILNVPSDWKLGFVKLPVDFKHWILLRDIDGTFYNLDSKLSRPALIGTRDDLVGYLQERLGSEERTQVLLVVEPEVENSGAWHKPDTGTGSDSGVVETASGLVGSDSDGVSADIKTNSAEKSGEKCDEAPS
ncbi:josephin-2-like isoform X2 [Mya arenaria]|uniref:josephin-2-like isoform X2 n=1 Tax=Mya arenaria TaxID=6604 RepID=UPI0022E56522|nr:josephin-2-like isoform X2 [Mya arenaria]